MPALSRCICCMDPTSPGAISRRSKVAAISKIFDLATRNSSKRILSAVRGVETLLMVSNSVHS